LGDRREERKRAGAGKQYLRNAAIFLRGKKNAIATGKSLSLQAGFAIGFIRILFGSASGNTDRIPL